MICNNWNELKEQLEKNNTDEKIIFTNGCFDIIHSGHVSYLQKAKSLGDVLVLGLNSSASIKRLKGETRPINSEEDRAIVLNELKSVDYVVVFDHDTPYELIKTIKPFIIAKGGDYDTNEVVGKDIVESYGGRVEIIPFVDGKSTTNIIEKMRS
jgi:D-beta-D-heptose 7-phosphate kinase / D-beta-D-heptose 1-phosphate adenosyltransferase